MFRTKKITVMTFVGAITAVLLSTVFLDSGPVFAHGSIDQSNFTVVGGSSASNTLFFILPVGQEFTPSQSTLVGVDIDISSGNPQFGPDTLTVNIRKGTIASPILATASQSVAEDFSGLLHFDLPTPLGVTPGDKYVLEVQATKPTHAWNRSGDGYTGGAGIISGSVEPRIDWWFQTYSPEITPIVEVDIDIKPGSDPNSINLNSKVVIPVAILGSDTFDVNDVDRSTLKFGPSGATLPIPSVVIWRTSTAMVLQIWSRTIVHRIRALLRETHRRVSLETPLLACPF